ncbi:hypothetical protein [Limnoraphis robusta]|uniref:CopG-like ribbon-helix-helix domain-containing protein n=1 Tax=Limnoraphis robusta CS-951 TaxID=1637645 RepID=A0A0F5YA34_9CYAN|nr:hypothetical protein [Limnoraphis robusta]KKD35749.1 hypothetical protein WN50_23550 [Limnoraphis robusta CS-951]
MNSQTVPSKLPRVNVYIEEGLKRKGEKLAKKRLRSLSNLLVWLLQQEIESAEKTGEIDSIDGPNNDASDNQSDGDTSNGKSDDSEE